MKDLMNDPVCITGYFDDRKVWSLDDGEQHWIVATSEDEAVRFYYTTLGYKSREEYIRDMGDIECKEVDPLDDLTIEDRDNDTKSTKAARTWLLDVKPENSPTILATTAY